MPRAVLLSLAGLLVFGVVAALMTRVMPGPMAESDYLVVGSVATLVSMLVVFLAVLSSMKTPDAFFKRRRRK